MIDIDTIITAIKGRLKDKQDDIAAFIRTGYSFEEWLNWEIFAALANLYGHKAVTPKGKYDGSQLSDVHVKTDDFELFIEVKLLHEWSMTKWRRAVDDDVEKLKAMARGGRSGLLIVFLGKNPEEYKSSENPYGKMQADWDKWLDQLKHWKDIKQKENYLVGGKVDEESTRLEMHYQMYQGEL